MEGISSNSSKLMLSKVSTMKHLLQCTSSKKEKRLFQGVLCLNPTDQRTVVRLQIHSSDRISLSWPQGRQRQKVSLWIRTIQRVGETRTSHFKLKITRIKIIKLVNSLNSSWSLKIKVNQFLPRKLLLCKKTIQDRITSSKLRRKRKGIKLCCLIS